MSNMNYSFIVFISSPLSMDQEILLVTITLNQDNSASFLEAQPFWKKWVQLIWTQSRRCNPREHSLNDNGWSKRPFQLQSEWPSPPLDICQMLNQRRKDSFSNIYGTKKGTVNQTAKELIYDFVINLCDIHLWANIYFRSWI